MPSIHTSNKEALKEIITLYGKEFPIVLDMTFGTGAFWDKPPTITLDLNQKANIKGNFNYLPLPSNFFDIVVFDPPYRMNGGFTINHSTTTRYKNKRANYKLVPDYYKFGTIEAHRVLKHKGILIAKMQDQVVSGNMYFQTNKMLSWAEKAGFIRLIDEIIVATGIRPQPQGRIQKHIRTAHSTFQVWRK